MTFGICSAVGPNRPEKTGRRFPSPPLILMSHRPTRGAGVTVEQSHSPRIREKLEPTMALTSSVANRPSVAARNFNSYNGSTPKNNGGFVFAP